VSLCPGRQQPHSISFRSLALSLRELINQLMNSEAMVITRHGCTRFNTSRPTVIAADHGISDVRALVAFSSSLTQRGRRRGSWPRRRSTAFPVLVPEEVGSVVGVLLSEPDKNDEHISVISGARGSQLAVRRALPPVGSRSRRRVQDPGPPGALWGPVGSATRCCPTSCCGAARTAPQRSELRSCQTIPTKRCRQQVPELRA
jgi:hypothetical protein